MDTSKSCACGCFIILLNVESLEEAIFFYNFVQSSLPSKIYPIQISWPIYSKFGNESMKVFSSDGKRKQDYLSPKYCSGLKCQVVVNSPLVSLSSQKKEILRVGF